MLLKREIFFFRRPELHGYLTIFHNTRDVTGYLTDFSFANKIFSLTFLPFRNENTVQII